MLNKVKILAAAAALAGSLGATSGSANALSINISFGPGIGVGPSACRYMYRPGVSRWVVRNRLRARGFRMIRNIRFVRGHRISFFRCKPGKFVSCARRGFSHYRVKSTARTGRPYQVRRIGGFGPGLGMVSRFVVKHKLFIRGYRFINVIGVRFRFGRRVYVSFARKFGRRFVVYSSVRTGRPFHRRRIF